MAEINAELVKQLRQMTGAGIMDCKKALKETNGDLEAAAEYLRKAGIAKAAKKLSREAKEGRIEAALSSDRKQGAMVLLATETDFVAKNELFVKTAKKLAEIALKNKINSAEELLSAKMNESTVEEELKILISKIGENIKPAKVAYLEASENGIIHYYIHPGNRIGVMVEITSDDPSSLEKPETIELANELAMQIAFSKPLAITEDEIPKETLEKEREIYLEQAKQSGKPEKAIQKIVEGKLRKFIEQQTLLNQEYIREAKTKVIDIINRYGKKVGAKFGIKRFVWFEVGG